MKNITITEIDGKDVDFEQTIDSDSVTALAGGVAVNGNVEDSAVNTGRNDGIMAGDDVKLEDSILGDGNTQLNDSWIGAFAGKGDATNAQGENVNLGSGELVDVDTGFGDAQVITGNGNEVTGDVDTTIKNADGPVNVAVGDENRQYGFEDNSTNIEDSFKVDASIEDSGNEVTQVDLDVNVEDNDEHTTLVKDSGNFDYKLEDIEASHETYTYEDNSSHHETADWVAEMQSEMAWDHHDLDLDV